MERTVNTEGDRVGPGVDGTRGREGDIAPAPVLPAILKRIRIDADLRMRGREEHRAQAQEGGQRPGKNERRRRHEQASGRKASPYRVGSTALDMREPHRGPQMSCKRARQAETKQQARRKGSIPGDTLMTGRQPRRAANKTGHKVGEGFVLGVVQVQGRSVQLGPLEYMLVKIRLSVSSFLLRAVFCFFLFRSCASLRACSSLSQT